MSKYKLNEGWTQQRMIDLIRKNNDGTRAVGVNGYCQYQAPNGNRCAAGCFIPDEHMTQLRKFQGNVEGLFYYAKEKGINLNFPMSFDAMTSMQVVHDTTAKSTKTGRVRRLLINWIKENTYE